MSSIDIVIETPISTSVRAEQVSSMFDVPAQNKCRLEWHGDLPIEDRPWNIGLIVGPSGCGKSTILKHVFGESASFEWSAASVIDDFGKIYGVETIAQICQAVGFNTIPAWLRPYGVLSNGEKFRVDLARRLLEGGEIVACDEFTSVIDRQVAQIGSHAAQKYTRRNNRKFVAATCHYDLEEWLQPDWVLEPATMVFRWRSVQRRPAIACSIQRVPYEVWHIFARFHYLTADLSRGAKCFLLSVDGRPAAFAAALHRPHPAYKGIKIYGMSRLVTLPDYQGLGLAFALCDRIGAAFRAIGKKYHAYPAHPSLIRSFDRSPVWRLKKKPGFSKVSTRAGGKSTLRQYREKAINDHAFGERPCAVFSYCGAGMDNPDEAHGFLGV